MIDKGDDNVAEEQQAFARTAVRNIGKLRWADAQFLAQYLPVALGLIQHVDKIAVFQNVFDFPRCKQILDILR